VHQNNHLAAKFRASDDVRERRSAANRRRQTGRQFFEITLESERMLMLVPEQQLQILLCTEPIDMRNGANGLAGIVRDALAEEPLSSKLFVFQSKRGDSVKIFYWHHNGFAVWSKRIQSGRFRFPKGEAGTLQISRSALRMILKGIDLQSFRKSA
jgi:transposase